MKIVFLLTNCAKKCTTQLHVLYGPVNEVVFYRLRKEHMKAILIVIVYSKRKGGGGG